MSIDEEEAMKSGTMSFSSNTGVNINGHMHSKDRNIPKKPLLSSQLACSPVLNQAMLCNNKPTISMSPSCNSGTLARLKKPSSRAAGRNYAPLNHSKLVVEKEIGYAPRMKRTIQQSNDELEEEFMFVRTEPCTIKSFSRQSPPPGLRQSVNQNNSLLSLHNSCTSGERTRAQSAESYNSDVNRDIFKYEIDGHNLESRPFLFEEHDGSSSPTSTVGSRSEIRGKWTWRKTLGFACIWLALMVFLSLFLLIFFSTRPLQGLQILSFDSLYSNSTHYELELLISAHNPNLHAIKIGQYNYKYHPTASTRRHRRLPSNNNSINSIIDDNDDHDDGDDDDDDEGGHKWSQSTNIDLHLFVQQQTVSGTFSDEILLDYVTHFYPANDSIRTPTPLLLQPLTTTTVKARVLAQKSSRPGLRIINLPDAFMLTMRGLIEYSTLGLRQTERLCSYQLFPALPRLSETSETVVSSNSTRNDDAPAGQQHPRRRRMGKGSAEVCK